MSLETIPDDPQLRERFNELKPPLTAQAATIEARPPICITHAPGYMLVCDVRVEDLVLL